MEQPKRRQRQHPNNRSSSNNISSSSSSSSSALSSPSSSSSSALSSPSSNFNNENDGGKCGFIFHVLVIILGLLYYSNIKWNRNNNIVTTKSYSNDVGKETSEVVDADDPNDSRIILLDWSLIVPTIIVCVVVTILLSYGAMNIVYATPSNYTAIETIHDTYQLIQQRQRKKSAGRRKIEESDSYSTKMYDDNHNNNDNNGKSSAKTNPIIIPDIIDLDVSFINDLVTFGEGEM